MVAYKVFHPRKIKREKTFQEKNLILVAHLGGAYLTSKADPEAWEVYYVKAPDGDTYYTHKLHSDEKVIKKAYVIPQFNVKEIKRDYYNY